MRDALVEGIVQLRLAAMAAGPGYVGGASAQQDMTSFVAEALRHAMAQSSHRHLLHEGRVAAHVTMWTARESWYGSPTQYWLLDHRLGDVHAARWTIQQLAQWSARVDASSDMTLTVAYPHLMQAALGIGLSLDCVQLVGKVNEALSAVQCPRLASESAPWRAWGLEVCALRAQLVPQVMQLRQRVFSADPQHCWFGANAAFLAREGQVLEAACRNIETGAARGRGQLRPLYWVIARDQTIVGFFSAVPTASPYWGLCAGLDLCLDASLQGRGLARPIYRRCLKALADQGVEQFRGGTSQPAVMKIGREMGRQTIAWTLRQSSRFEPGHFGVTAQIARS